MITNPLTRQREAPSYPTQRRVMLTAAAVWPFVRLMVENHDTGDEAAFSLAFTNAGVDPAKMQVVRVSIDGNATRN